VIRFHDPIKFTTKNSLVNSYTVFIIQNYYSLKSFTLFQTQIKTMLKNMRILKEFVTENLEIFVFGAFLLKIAKTK